MCFICVKLRTDYGLGRYLVAAMSDMPRHQLQVKWTYIESIFMPAGVSIVKISVAFCLLRFSISPRQRLVLHGSIVLIILFTIGCCGYIIFACIPVEANWNWDLLRPPFGTGNAHCISDRDFLNLGIANSGWSFPARNPDLLLSFRLPYQRSIFLRTPFSPCCPSQLFGASN